MDLDTLSRFDWVTAGAPTVRLVLRRDGSGFYERDAGPGLRALREHLLHRLEGAALSLKFAHARGWVEVEARLSPGTPGADGRMGRYLLELATDPYVAAVEDRPAPPLTLESDAGAALED